MVGLGAVATVVTIKRGDPPAIPAALVFFAVMEGLQWWGYQSIGQCSLPSNRWATILSYVHIAFQPVFINAFALALVAPAASPRTRAWVMGLAGLATALMLARMMPNALAGACVPGSALCGAEWCTLPGTWHLAWTMPLSNIWGLIGGVSFETWVPFPDYMLAVFLLPLFYGAWRFALMHALLGPILASSVTNSPNEMPAIWCLFSVGLILVSLSPWIRRRVAPA